MKAKVLELQQLFVDRIEVGEFEVVKVRTNDTDDIIEINIDGYEFTYYYFKGILGNVMSQMATPSFMKLPKINQISFLIEAIKNNK
jgi:hypothetical protein